MVQALNLILQYFLHFFTGDKTFCHRWQNTFSPVRKTIRAWSCDTKTMLLWPKDLALTASSTSGTRQKGLSLFAEGLVLIGRRACPYSQKGLSFRVDHHGDPPNTPWGICQPSIVSRTTLYSVSHNNLYPFGRNPISYTRLSIKPEERTHIW